MLAAFFLVGYVQSSAADPFAFVKNSGPDCAVDNGRLTPGGEYEIQAGQGKPIHSFRANCESTRPPSYGHAIRSMARNGDVRIDPKIGQLYDAGISKYNSGKCDGMVPARTIGIRINSEYCRANPSGGTEHIDFWKGGDTVTLNIICASRT